jgi:thiosulfate dehydrogenase
VFRAFIVGVLFAVLATAIAGFVIIQTGTMPANADARPPAFERWAAKTSLHRTLNRARRLVDPLALNDRNVIAGIKVYDQSCAVCHGDSRAIPTTVARGLYQRPPQLARYGVEDDPQWVTRWKVQHGIRWTGMPAFGPTLSETAIWQVTMFLKTMDHLSPGPQAIWKRFRVAEALAR